MRGQRLGDNLCVALRNGYPFLVALHENGVAQRIFVRFEVGQRKGRHTFDAESLVFPSQLDVSQVNFFMDTLDSSVGRNLSGTLELLVEDVQTSSLFGWFRNVHVQRVFETEATYRVEAQYKLWIL